MDVRARVERLAIEQGGFLSWRDLRALSLSPRQINRAVRRGVLVHRDRGVYALPEVSLDSDVRAKAMALKGTLSHDTAAMWWGLELAHTPEMQHLTVPRNRGRRCYEVKGWRIHRYDLAAADTVIKNGLSVTTPLRTVLDCARLLPIAAAVAICDSALRRRLVTAAGVQAAIAALPAGPGRRQVTKVLTLADQKAGSVLESLLRMLLWESGLLPPETQFAIRGAITDMVGYFDFAWPTLRLVVETDGFEFHSQREHLRRDCRRHNALTLGGWWLLRFTWEDVVLFPESVVATVREAIDRLGAVAASCN